MTALKQFSILLFVLLFSANAYSQKNKEVKVTGHVIDKDVNQPLEYATIAFYQDGEVVNGGITDTEGNFSIDVKAGTYNIRIEYISYETIELNNKVIEVDTDLGNLRIGINVEALDAVEVIAERTTVEIKLDKKIYNIGKDLTTSGGTVSDALNNVPSVTVDMDGAISLRGNENVRILINGKPSAMAGYGDTNVLSQLPAEAIDRVEVITSPSARYDAEGTAGILNIILKQKETLGFNGSFNFTVGNPDNVGLSANLNYRTEKFNLFSNLGYRYFDAPRNSNRDTKYFSTGTYVPEFDRIKEHEKVSRLNRNYNANVGLEYFLTEKSSLTASLFYRFGQDEDLGINRSNRFNDGLMVEQTVRRENEKQDGDNYQVSLNYINRFNDEGHELRADFQYENRTQDELTNITENYIFTDKVDPDDFQEERIDTNEERKEYLIQSDYVLPLGEDSQFEAGFRGNYEKNLTDYVLQQEDPLGVLQVNDTLSNLFDYRENVTALYSQYGSKFGKFSFLLGLRLEQTQLKGNIDSELSDQELEDFYGFPIQTDFNNNYLGLFPTVNLIYNFGADDTSEESVTLGYNRRINRPRGWYINPFPSRSSRTNVFQGNPNLQPSFSNSFDLGYIKRWETLTLTTSVYYQRESGSVERIEEGTGFYTSDGIEIIRTIPVNLSTNIRAGGELGLMYNPTKWLRLNGGFNIFQNEVIGEFNGVDYGAKNLSWFSRFSSKVSLPAKIDWQTNFFYRGPRENSQTRSKGFGTIDLAFSKDILKNNGTLSLNVRDVLNSGKFRSFTATDSFERDSEFQWRQRQINLSFIYRFNQQKKRNERGNQNNYEDDEGGDFQGGGKTKA